LQVLDEQGWPSCMENQVPTISYRSRPVGSKPRNDNVVELTPLQYVNQSQDEE
jgi:hypothetical protein